VREADALHASNSTSHSSSHSSRHSHSNSTDTRRRPKHKHTHVCAGANSSELVVAPADWEGLVVRGRSSKQIYLVREGVLRGVPDLDTFVSLGFDLEKDVTVVSDKEVLLLRVGSLLPKAG
jgi:hypothetical protein